MLLNSDERVYSAESARGVELLMGSVFLGHSLEAVYLAFVATVNRKGASS